MRQLNYNHLAQTFKLIVFTVLCLTEIYATIK
jgi:hypothetical protein